MMEILSSQFAGGLGWETARTQVRFRLFGSRMSLWPPFLRCESAFILSAGIREVKRNSVYDPARFVL